MWWHRVTGNIAYGSEGLSWHPLAPSNSMAYVAKVMARFPFPHTICWHRLIVHTCKLVCNGFKNSGVLIFGKLTCKWQYSMSTCVSISRFLGSEKKKTPQPVAQEQAKRTQACY
ncbi:hypothetical protein SEVIR_8G196733v4 [Setaria viridis]|uniref:Uncharacterized protein n=1 Tax=Setaria viridis TaxID=4556 RepID=A0A4U6THB2_SETVI|nr:hypothetical protein SEVIR_8G196733v2 [Setaria viridis]